MRALTAEHSTSDTVFVKLDPIKYKDHIVYENNQQVIYVVILMAIYGMLIAALLWYKKFRSDLEEVKFVFNPYDPCICNRMVNKKQQTVRFHVDDLKSSHVSPKVHDLFASWLQKQYGKFGEVKIHRGKVHDYLGMTFDYSQSGVVHGDVKFHWMYQVMAMAMAA